jgi:hypothetical protein
VKKRTAARVLGALCLIGLNGAAPAPPDWAWEGTYAAELRIGTLTRVPLVGSERSVTASLLLVEVERRGDGWVQHQKVCGVAVRSRLRMTVPDAFVHSIPARTYTSVRAGAGEARRYTADLGVEAIGFDPSLTGGELPKDGAAPGVLDSDGDGHPGATVVGHFPLFGRVRLYVAQRSHLVLTGRQTGEDRIEGGVEIRLLEQRTLGASNGIFRRTLETRPDPATSGFVMVRTAADDCDALREEAPGLFPGSGW